MQKSILFLASVCCIAVVSFVLSSCKDDEPFVKPKLSVSKSTQTVAESAGTVDVDVKLDKAFSTDIIVEYTLGGTATQGATGDYEVVGTLGEVEIQSGQTTGTITLTITSDAIFEGNETIEVRIKDVNSDQIDITDDDKTIVTITDDDVQSKVSFTASTLTVKESDGLIEVEVQLDKPSLADVTVKYSLSGSARDSVTAVAADPDLSMDYAIAGAPGQLATPGQVVIPAGQTTAKIRIRLKSDLILEDTDPNTLLLDPEKIILTISEVIGGAIDTNSTMEISLRQEDGLLILLFWPDPDGDAKADMDILLRVGNSTTDWLGVFTGSVSDSFEGPEGIFLPLVLDFPAYGLSYVYYDGTLDPLEFDAIFVDIVNGEYEATGDSETFTSAYTAANINKWSDATTTQVVQTFEKVGGAFTMPSDITVPASGSRVGSYDNFHSAFGKGTYLSMPKSIRRFRGQK